MEEELEWRTDHALVGARVARSHEGQDGELASSIAVVVGWLSAKESDFVDGDGKAAPLFRVRYEAGDLAGDEEDLEEHEILTSVPSEAASDASYQAYEPYVHQPTPAMAARSHKLKLTDTAKSALESAAAFGRSRLAQQREQIDRLATARNEPILTLPRLPTARRAAIRRGARRGPRGRGIHRETRPDDAPPPQVPRRQVGRLVRGRPVDQGPEGGRAAPVS